MLRLTDLINFLGDPQNNDLIHVVDVSDTTDDPAGTSKPATLIVLKNFFNSMVQDEGIDVVNPTKINFLGAGVNAVDNAGVADVTIPGGSVPVEDEGTPVVAAPTAINFIGAGVTAVDNAGVADVTIPGNTPVEDEGAPVVSNPTAINFIGAGVTAADNAGVADVTVPGVTPGSITQTEIDTSSLNPIVQVVRLSDSAVADTNVIIPSDDTIPQNTEGGEFMTLAITPTDVNNLIIVEVNAMFGCNLDLICTMALFRDSTANALAATGISIEASGQQGMLTIRHSEIAGTLSAVTWRMRAGPSAGGIVTFNGRSGARIYGGVANSSIHIYEIQQ